MLTIALVMIFLSFALIVVALITFSSESDRPTLKLQDLGGGDAELAARRHREWEAAP